MMARRLPIVAVLLLVLLPAAPCRAQSHWDQREYVDLIEHGQRTYDEAMSLPRSAVQRRNGLLIESARAKASARRLLTLALAAGEFDGAFTEAMADWFNLSENLVVTLTLLYQCEAAELIVDELEAERARLQSDALAHLDTLHTRIDDCRSDVNSTEGASSLGWSLDRFERLRDDADTWLLRSEESEPGSQAQRSFLLESVWQREQSVDLLRITLFTYAAAPGLDDPATTLLDQYPLLVDGLVELGFCDAAARRLAQRQLDVRVLGAAPETSDAELTDRIETCRVERGE